MRKLWPKTKTPIMKRKSGSQSAFSNWRVLTVLLTFLAGIFLALFATANPSGRGFAAVSNATAEGREPPKTAASTADARASRENLAFKSDPTRHLDKDGYRPSGIALSPPGSQRRGTRAEGGGAWSKYQLHRPLGRIQILRFL
jgi:hypothetical protein